MKIVYKAAAQGFIAEVLDDENEAGQPQFTTRLRDGSGKIVFESPRPFIRRNNARRSIRSVMNKEIKDVAFDQSKP